MATGGSLDKIGKEEDVRNSCCLCMEPYRGRCPKLLPCFHTFCLPCLTALEASVRSARNDTAPGEDLGQKEAEQLTHTRSQDTEGEAMSADPVTDTTGAGDKGHNDVAKTSFPCPTCRAPVPIPEGGVSALQTNFYVDHEAETEVVCDMCEEDSRQHASHVCHQCSMNMCRTCRRCHDIMARDHHVTSVSLGQPAKKKGEQKSTCLVHRDQVLCFHCRQCDVSICVHCKVTSHGDHDTVDVVSAAVQAREEISSLIPTAQQQLQVVEMSIQQVDLEDRQLTCHAEEVTQKIHLHYDTLMTWASQSRDRLVEEVRAKEALAHSQLQAEKVWGTLTQDTLSSLLSHAARATATDPDVMTRRKELKGALLSDHRLDQLRQRADCQVHSWGWSYDVTDVSEDDVRALLGRMVEDSGADVTRGPVSLQELAKRVNDLEKKSDDLEKKSNDLEKKSDDLEKRSGDFEKKSEDLEKKTDDLEKNASSLRDEMTISRKTEADLQKLMQSLSDNLGKARQLFHVRGLDRAKTKRLNPVIFTDVDKNKDGRYNMETGEFTAPQTGLYFFTAGVRSHKEGVTVQAFIRIDGDLLCFFQGCHGGGSGSAVVSLTAGERVWVMACNPGDLYLNSGDTCHFSGTLVLPAL